MPIYNGNYVAPVWINGVPPAINDVELLAMSRTIQASQVLTGYGPPSQYVNGAVGQRYADISTDPPTIYKLLTAAEEANVWELDDSSGNLAQEYQDNTGYAEGAYCLHNGMIYQANTDISGETWTDAHWTRVWIADELADHVGDDQNPHRVTAAQIGAVLPEDIAPTESSTTASQGYSVGNYLMLFGRLYKVTAPIEEGDTITVNTNVTPAVLGDDVANQKVRVGTISLSATWTGTTTKSQVVTVTGAVVRADSRIELQPSPQQMKQFIEAGVQGLTAENNNGVVTVYAIGDTPASAMTIQCTVTEESPGGGGGGGGEMTLKIADINSTAELLSLNSYTFTVKDCAGKYAAILFWARGTITIPANATIVYSAQRIVTAYNTETDIYLVKVPISSSNETITIGNDSQSRAGGVCFVVSQDFTVTEAAKNNDLSATMTWSAGIYVFAAISISNATSVGVLSQYTPPVSYIFPDTTGNTSSATSRMLAGIINAVTANNTATRIGNYGSDSLSGLFVCLKIDPA